LLAGLQIPRGCFAFRAEREDLLSAIAGVPARAFVEVEIVLEAVGYSPVQTFCRKRGLGSRRVVIADAVEEDQFAAADEPGWPAGADVHFLQTTFGPRRQRRPACGRLGAVAVRPGTAAICCGAEACAEGSGDDQSPRQSRKFM